MRVACFLFKNDVDLEGFAQACLRFSPQIALSGSRILFIEIEKCRRIFSEKSFIARAEVLLSRFNYQAQLAMGEDIPTALAFAKYPGHENWEQLPLAAVIDFLDPFAKDGEGRRIVEKMVDALTRLGIRNLAQLRSLAIDQFPARFGRLGLYCRQQLEGSRQVIWPAWQPPLQWIEKIDFMDSEYALSIEPLLFKAKSGLDRLLSRLRGGHLRADCLELTVRQERYSTVDEPLRKWVFEFIVPQSSTRGILPILRERLTWDLMRKPLFAPVQTISLEISRTSPARGHQNDFLNAESHFDEKMGTFFGQLEEFLGKGQVFWADITEDRFPEKSWVRTQIPRASEIDLKNRYPLRPTRVFKHPLPLKINKNRVSLKGRTAQISRTSAVERISSHWLEGFPARDYFILELKTGSVLWVFRGLGENYYLHGFYE